MSSPPVATAGPPSSLAGIIATKQDLAPSIVFTIAYALLAPLAIWHAVKRETRSYILIRPAIFLLVRVGTYIVRAVEANGNYSVGIIAAELVLLTVGTVLLIEPLIALIKNLLEAWVPYDGPVTTDRRGRRTRRDAVGLLSRVLKLALLVVIVLSLYTSSKIGAAFRDPGAAKTVSTMRKIISIIIVAVLGICVVGLVYFHFLHTLPARPLFFLILIALLLQVTSAYRLASVLGDSGAKNQYEIRLSKPNEASHISLSVAFWLASALPEWLVTAAYFAINLNSLIPGTARPEPEKKRGANSYDAHPNSAA